MCLHFYYKGDKTGLLPGDVIKNDSGKKLTFYRNGERMLVGDARENRDDAYEPPTSHFTFFEAIELITGYKITETDRSECHSILTIEWTIEP